MNITRGDVVLINAPFITRPGSKIRPMLVIQNDANNQRMQNTILATITTNMIRVAESTQVLVDVSTPEGKQSGLINNSVVSTENLLTVRQAQITRSIGQLPDSLMNQVNLALKSSLAIS